MDFVNKGFGNILKIFIAILVAFVFLKSIPVIIFIGVASWIGIKGMKYFKKFGSEKKERKENIDYRKSKYEEKDDFDFKNKNVIDVDYEDIKK